MDALDRGILETKSIPTLGLHDDLWTTPNSKREDKCSDGWDAEMETT